jgi:rhamnose utilization protein RhaD (predicted bifunctional aldolase and dehydrogenase)
LSDLTDELITLSRDLGREDRRLTILGEGNTSARVGIDTFLIKASGSSLSTLSRDDVTECRFAPLLELLDRSGVTDADVAAALVASRVDPEAKRPSTEAFFHAYLLSLPGVGWVAHTHPVAVNGILCSPRAGEFATRRMFPDEIVCCGQRSAIVPYVDPGLQLSLAIREAVEAFRREADASPRVLLLANHGLIAPASTAAGVLAATLMTVKAAEIFTLAASHGGPTFLTTDDVHRIESREDEAYRRRQLKL